MVGQSTSGNLVSDGAAGNTDDTKKRRRRGFQCPYRGWEFNLDGQLIEATNMKGIENFSPKDYGLTPIPVQQVGPVVFLNFGGVSGKKGQHVGKMSRPVICQR
jgi:phenylpropionate dioxygenase-like ring-hydroxylating dioxygenase large terminal subunit